jgi:hypothetical protein
MLSFSFVLSGASRGCFSKQKTRDCFGNRGFVGNSICYGLENSTHDARQTGTVMPNGRVSLDWLHALRVGERVFHFLTLLMKWIFGSLSMSKKFRFPFYNPLCMYGLQAAPSEVGFTWKGTLT